MLREIFEVYAKIVDANGSYNTLSGYPKMFDSRSYNGNIEKARQRAYGEFYECLGAMSKRDDRQVQFAMIIQASNGLQIECKSIGELPQDPDPEPEPEPEPVEE